MNYRFLLPITGLFTATLLIANTLDTKIFDAFGLALPAGIIVFPLAYLFGDILTEVYGYATARRVIWTGFAGLVLMLVCYEVARILPPAGFWVNDDAFRTIFAHVPRIVVASIAAYFCGEFVNSFIVAKMKIAQQGNKMWSRFLVSTVAGQFVDTAVFIAIAFTGTMPFKALISVFISAWLVKVAWEAAALPITVSVVKRIKQAEGVDHFDTDTNFSPFRL